MHASSRHLFGAAALLVCAGLAAPTPLPAQDAVPIAGRVQDTAGQSLAGADIQVLGSFWSTVSGRDGAFRLALPPGAWSLRVARIGYRPDTVRVTVAAGARPLSLEVRLSAAPIQLKGLSVEAPRAPPLAQTVTVETVRQVPPLGEPDIFRAVVLLPGISQPNDLKGRIHLAGGASDETGVRLDGHPLQDPFHLLGLFGAFNVAALERADVLIHHVPPSMGGRLSGVIDLDSRRAGEGAEYEAVVSLLTSGFTAVLPPGRWGVDVLASGRITYLDRVAPHISPDIPQFGFRDALLRLGRSWGAAWRVEALAFNTEDHFRDPELSGFDGYEPLTWGESLLGVRVERHGAAWSLEARASFDRASVHLDERIGIERSNYVDSRRDWASGALSIARTARRWRVTAGVGLDHRRNRQAWIARGLADEIFSPNTPEEYEGARSWSAPSVFGEAQVELGERWTAAAGARLWDADRLRIAPRLHLGFRVSDAIELDAAYDRRYQFGAQLEEPIEGSVAAPLFLIDAPRQADVLAAAARLRPRRLPFGATGALELQLFHKRYRKRTLLPDLPVGETRATIGPGFPTFDRIRGSSAGAALGGRLAFENGLLLQGSYTYQQVRQEIGGATYPTAWDAPHTLALFASVPFWRKWTLNAVVQTHSGRATTPVLARSYEPSSFAELNDLTARYLRGERNSLRIPPYRRLDLGVRRMGRLWGADFTLAIQVLNILARDNPIDYDWQQYFAFAGVPGLARPGRSGLPIVPSIGVEARW